MSFKPIEPKRDEFRKYLERSAIIEALTKVFSKLIDEDPRPEDPLKYIRENLGDTVLEADNIAMLQAELETAKDEIERLRKLLENAEINTAANDEAVNVADSAVSQEEEEEQCDSSVNNDNNEQ